MCISFATSKAKKIYTTPRAAAFGGIMHGMNELTKRKRPYRLITAETVAKHQALAVIHGNGSAAVLALDADYKNLGDRAYRIRKKAESMPTSGYIEEGLQQIASEGIQELGELVHSADEKLRYRVATYAIDQVRGKAITRSIGISAKTNIQSVID